MWQKFRISAFILSVVFSTGAAQASELSVAVKTDFAAEVLAEVCSDAPVDEAHIRRSGAAKDMLSHFVKFRGDFTMDNYVAARKAAAQCQALDRDIFRFGDVIDKREVLRAQLGSILEQEERLPREISGMIQSMSPAGTVYDGAAILMIGTPSCGGWSNGPTFYVDVPCLDGDTQATLFLTAHETYHGVQDQFMPAVDETAPSMLRLFDTVIREGTALYIADYSRIENPGRYAKLNQDTIKTNRRRMQENFDLFDMLAVYLNADGSQEAYSKAYSIGASGFFDSPLYSIGDHMTTALTERYGSETVICLMQLPANHFFAAYDALRGEGPEEGGRYYLSATITDAAQGLGIDETAMNVCLAPDETP